MTEKKCLRIGNAGGYWGDDPWALKRQVDKGELDYITMDFLAEVTMSILRKQRARDPEAGYAKDFIPMLQSVLPDLLQRKTRIITNAGGINPEACARAIRRMADEMKLKPVIAVVYGDDILEETEQLQKAGANFSNMENSRPLSDVAGRLEAANVYFGALPVVEALKKWSPDIIITGRVTDTGITVAPMIHEFGWDMQDWDRIAAGIVAGHMLECGSQITGGNHTDWKKICNFDEMGYPVVEVSEDGSFVLTKHSDTGGMVTVDTVREQTFYEMGDPGAYLTPDVVADFRTITLQQDGPDRVRVSGIKGYEPTELYKVSMAYQDGFKCAGLILISGPDARAKAEAFAEIFWKRCPYKFSETLSEYIGWNACHRSLVGREDGNEIILKLAVRSDDEKALRAFGKMIPSLILSGPPGVTVLGGVPRPQSVISYWPALIPKHLVTPKIALFGGNHLEGEELIGGTRVGSFSPEADASVQSADKALNSLESALKDQRHPDAVALGELALARSGDKGDRANIGVLARNEAAYQFLKEYLTAQRVKDWFQELCQGQVRRYTLDGLRGLNFLLDESLGGGGSCTLRSDAQGKTFSQAILNQKVLVPEKILAEVRAGNH